MKKDAPKELLEEYDQKREILESGLKNLKDHLKRRLGRLRREKGTRARLTDARVKKPGKIWKKVIKYGYSPHEAFEKIVDILGIRIVCNNLSDTQSVIEMLQREGNVLDIKKIKDMVIKPMDDGYRAIHVRAIAMPYYIKNTEKTPCEIQIRTLTQDTWARLSRADLYGKRAPKTIADLTRALSKQLSAIDDMAQLIRDELDKPAEKAQDIKESDSISPQRLALLYKQKYDDDLWEGQLHGWVLNLEEAEVETIKEVIDLLDDDQLRKELDGIAEHIRGYPLKNSEWIVFSAKVASELRKDAGISSVKDDIESEWDELSTIALRETLPGTIEDFIKELEYATRSTTKDSEDSHEECKMYFSLLGCMDTDIYGNSILDEWCTIEAIINYYKAQSYEERLTELLDDWVARYE